MRKADFEARIRKIEIVNLVLHDSFAQTLRVTLDEVELSNENLLEVRQFRPNEVVHVEITPAQLGLADLAAGSGVRAGSGTRGLAAAPRAGGAGRAGGGGRGKPRRERRPSPGARAVVRWVGAAARTKRARPRHQGRRLRS